MNKEIHPLAEIMPDLSQKDYQELLLDIQTNGLLDPITLFEGKVLDGRNRLRACQEAGVEPQFVEFTGSDPAAFVLSKNVTRRHFKPGQKAMVVVKMKELVTQLKAQAKKRSLNNLKKGAKSPIPSRDGIGTDAAPDEEEAAATEAPEPEPAQATNKHNNTTAAKLGKAAGVSESTVGRTNYVYDHGTPEDIREVESGEKSVNKKAKEIRERKAPKKAHQNRSRAKTEGVASSENAFVIHVKNHRIKEYLQDLMHVAREDYQERGHIWTYLFPKDIQDLVTQEDAQVQVLLELLQAEVGSGKHPAKAQK